LVRDSTCSNIGADTVHMRFMLDTPNEVEYVKKPTLTACIQDSYIGGRFELDVDYSSEVEYCKEEFARAKILAVWQPESRW
jgi:aspartate carbamoyltransferase regulatory subunit